MKVLLIGNGVSVATTEVSARVASDEFDLVVRFNCWRKMPDTVGDRCDLWVTNLSPHDTVKWLPRAAAEGYTSKAFAVNPGAGEVSERCHYFVDLIKEAWGADTPVEIWDPRFSREIKKAIRRKPTTGIVAVHYFVSRGDDVTLHGFDTLTDATFISAHYWGGPSNLRRVHSSKREGAYLRRLLSEGKIKLMTTAPVEPVSVASPPPQATPTIPKIMHHIWLGSAVPDWMQGFINGFREQNPEWKSEVWTSLPDWADDTLREAYEGCEQWCQRSDIIRYLVLERFGGIYIDSDCVPLRPLDPLCALGPGWTCRQSDGRYINGIMGAEPSCALMTAALEGVRETYRSLKAEGRTSPIKRADYGPNLITRLKRSGKYVFWETMKHYFLLFDRRKSAHNFWNSSSDSQAEQLQSLQRRVADGEPPFMLHLWGVEGSSKRKINEAAQPIADHWHVFNKRWRSGGRETSCGSGSLWRNVSKYIDALLQSFHAHGIKTLNDAGCGDMNWCSRVDLGGIDYLGYDLVQRLSKMPLPFEVLNIAEQPMRSADAVLCHQVLFHLPNDVVVQVIDQFRKSAPLLFATSHRGAPTKRHEWTQSLSHCFSPLDLETILGPPQTVVCEIDSSTPYQCFIGVWSLSENNA